MTSAESRITLGPGGFMPESTSTLERMDVRYGRLETRTMSKTKSAPGHEATTLNGLRDELVAFNQRCTRIEKESEQAIAVNGRCSTIAVIFAVLAILLAIANAGYLFWRAGS